MWPAQFYRRAAAEVEIPQTRKQRQTICAAPPSVLDALLYGPFPITLGMHNNVGIGALRGQPSEGGLGGKPLQHAPYSQMMCGVVVPAAAPANRLCLLGAGRKPFPLDGLLASVALVDEGRTLAGRWVFISTFLFTFSIRSSPRQSRSVPQ